MAKAKPELSPDASFEEAARLLLSEAFKKMMDNAARTRAGLKKSDATPQEIEALHDMRVGSRRLRAALDVFGAAFPPNVYRTLNEEVGDITDALGAVRDLDVQLSALRAEQEKAAPNEAYGIGRLIARRTKERDRERKALLDALDRLEKDRFARQFRRALDRALPASDDGKSKGEAA